MNESYNDNRDEIIEKAKKHILEATNIDTSPDEMKVLDNILYRCWQMGWLDKYSPRDDGIYMELFAVKDGIRYNAKEITVRDMLMVLSHSLTDGFEKFLLDVDIEKENEINE